MSNFLPSYENSILVVEVALIAWRVTFTYQKFLFHPVDETSFLRPGEGPKNTKKKKLQCFMTGNCVTTYPKKKELKLGPE